ncbi:MAG: hypothetical protein WAV20_08535 [Blastocatellia bacterium]
MSSTKMQRRLRSAGTLVLLGLGIELLSLLWSHPTAFILFLAPGTLLIAIGILIYFYSLVSVSEPATEE